MYRLDIMRDERWPSKSYHWLITPARTAGERKQPCMIGENLRLDSEYWCLPPEVHKWIIERGTGYSTHCEVQPKNAFPAHYNVWIDFKEVDLRVLFKLTWL
jgi:hypothetical protein